MTNLQDGADHHGARLQHQLLLAMPIGVAAVLAVLVLGIGVVPQWLKLQVDSERLAQLEQIKARGPLLRGQLGSAAAAQSSAERKQRQVLQLIEGSGELVTFLAQLDREAARFGVQLDLFEPVAAFPSSPGHGKKEASKGDQPPPFPPSPLEATGLKAQKVLLTARGRYPDVLAFLRAVEKLNLLVLQSNLALSAQKASTADKPTALTQPAIAKTELKLILTYYRSLEHGSATPASTKWPR